MRIYDYNKMGSRKKRGILWMIGTTIHYVFIAVFSGQRIFPVGKLSFKRIA